MSRASSYNVAWADKHLPQLAHGDYEPYDVVAAVLHWAEANGAERQDWHAEQIIADALEHFHAERGEGDDLANDPYYDALLTALLERAS